MTIGIGERLPEAALMETGPEGPEEVALGALLEHRRVAVFGMPGAFTRTCSGAHMPSLIRTRPQFAEKGVDEVLVVVVNDPFVAHVWADQTGALGAGVRVLADPSGAFIRAIGMSFDAPPVGFYGRSRRFSLLAEDGVVTALNEETDRGACDLTAGETLLAQI